jgi:hypothetical protein
MNRDAILAELLELEGMLLDSRLNDEDRHALHGAAQALRHVLDATTGAAFRAPTEGQVSTTVGSVCP